MNLQELLFQNHAGAQTYAGGTIGAFISLILPNVFTIIGIVLFIYLIFGGFLVVTAAGNQHNMEQGQQVITNAIIGFIIVFASYWLIQIIETVTGIKIV